MSRLLMALLLIFGVAGSATAQEVTAEVRTWSGESVVLADPTFEVFYTIAVQEQTGAAAGPAAGTGVGGVGAGLGVGAGGRSQPVGATSSPIGSQGYGAMQASGGGILPTTPGAIQGRRQQEFVTLARGGLEIRVPVVNIAALVFARQAVVGSALPPWVAAGHFRYAVTAVFSDGSQFQADYVNMGTSILRGGSPRGIVDVPWTEIETVRFRR
jgi:hypothetical protein